MNLKEIVLLIILFSVMIGLSIYTSSMLIMKHKYEFCVTEFMDGVGIDIQEDDKNLIKLMAGRGKIKCLERM